MSEVNAAIPFKIRVGVVVLKDNHILLVKQNGQPFWVFPGGTLEPDEGIAECAVRELKEEADLDIELTHLLYCSDFLQLKRIPPRHTLDVFFLAEWRFGDIPHSAPYPENIDAMAWVACEDLPELVIQPAGIAKQFFTDWSTQTLNKWPRWQNQYLGISG